MGKEPNLAAAPLIITVRDKEYKAFPLTNQQHEELDNWVRKIYLKRIKNLTDGDADYMRIALITVAAIDSTTETGLTILSTDVGVNKVAELMCRDQVVPELKESDKDFFENGKEIMDAYFEHWSDINKVSEPKTKSKVMKKRSKN